MTAGKVHIGNELPTYDIKGKRVCSINFDFRTEFIQLTLCKVMGGKEKRCHVQLSFENAQQIGLLNLEVLNDFFKRF